MKLLTCVLLSLYCICASAQLKPDYFPEEIPINISGNSCVFCKPGVNNKSRSRGIEIAYGLTPSSNFKAESMPFTAPLPSFQRLDYFLFDFKIPVVIKNSFNFLLSYKFSNERFNIREAGNEFPSFFTSLNGTGLKTSSIGFIISKPLNEINYLAIQGKYTASGSFPGIIEFRERSAIYKLRAIFGIKKNDDLEWGIGLSWSQSFRRTSFLPFVIFNRNFRDRWGIESVLPALIFIRYNANPKNILLFGPQYTSRSYRFYTDDNLPAALDYAINQSRIMTSVRWEHQLVPWVWTHLQVGYQINFASEFASKNTLPSFDADPADAPFFQISIFASPPK